jgi:hypothetical protein
VDPTRPAITDGQPAEPAEPTSKPAAPRALAQWLHLLADRAPQPVFEAMELGYNSVAIPRLLREGRAVQADLLYERYAFFNMAGAVASRRLGIPFVVEVNELAGYERVRDQSFVRLARAVERRVLRQASLIVTVSEFSHRRCEEIVEGQVPAVTIPNGVSADWLSNAVSSRESDRLRLELGLGNRPHRLLRGRAGALAQLLAAARGDAAGAPGRPRCRPADRRRRPQPRLHRGRGGPAGHPRQRGVRRSRAPRPGGQLHRAV